MSIAVVVGTRPEAIKLAPVVHELRARGIPVDLVVSGQHREMLDPVLSLFDLAPDVDLDLMSPNQSPAEFHARALAATGAHFRSRRPQMVILQGDTTTTLAAAEAAFYEKVPVAHVEAGLRTKRRYSPFPEEMNRTLVSHLATLHLAPTELAKKNLVAESIADDRIHVTGNTVVDALMKTVARLGEGRVMPAPLVQSLAGQAMLLVTGHRRENFGGPLRSICTALIELSGRLRDWLIVYPVHLNPNVDGPVRQLLAGFHNIHLLPPLDYLNFVALMNMATLILTDSGGIQEEAPSLGKPVLVMRTESERSEGVTAGTARLVGHETAGIVRAVVELAEDRHAYERMARVANPYGDGHAAERIAKIVERELRS